MNMAMNQIFLTYTPETSSGYVSKWNSMIPQLKKMAINGKFGGPTLYTNDTLLLDTKYIAYFVHHANPKPDFISWHFYVGQSYYSTATLKSKIAILGNEVKQVKAAIQANGDKVPPMFISEWNYAGSNKPPNASSAFLHTYVQLMYNEMVKDNIAGSAIFTTTDFGQFPPYLLINNQKVTGEGDQLMKSYETYVK